MNTRHLISIALLLSLLLFGATAFAQQGTTASDEAEQPYLLTAAWNPVGLADAQGFRFRHSPMVEFAGEFALDERAGLAVIGGWGTGDDSISDSTFWELGSQFNFYVVGDFAHGMQLGAQVIGQLEFRSGAAIDGEPFEEVNPAVVPGAYVGYKFVFTDLGFTFNAQAGMDLLEPFGNLWVGWSF